ncbi:MAG: RDD family protein [Candidatus Eremiobacteraeota bacterium]|nr:RDD family protein [Candidatus Eremiobacteraeota bacterium]
MRNWKPNLWSYSTEPLNFFSGKESLRERGEWLTLGITLLLAPSVLGVIGAFIHEGISVSSAAVLAVVAMIYVTLARGQLLGSSVLIDKQHFPAVFRVVERCASLLAVPVPLIFVRDDMQVPIVALGFGEPYSLVLSSHWLDHFQEDELTFMVGRELGHVAAGHTRLTSLLSVNGKENALVSLVFGAWLRRTEYTADRLGLLCCRSADAARRSITIATFHKFGRQVDIGAFALQRSEFTKDSVLRMGQWLSSAPYATQRMARIDDFVQSSLYARWEARISSRPLGQDLPAPVARSGRVTPQDCAGFGRRISAALIDVVVVSAIFGLTAPQAHAKIDSSATLAKLAHDPAILRFLEYLLGIASANGQHFVLTPLLGYPQYFFMYSVLLVAIAGQTLGMMIVAVKVTTGTFRRPAIWHVLWRYILTPLALGSFIFGPLVRIQLHDRFSSTRVVRLERAFERVASPA